MTCHLSLVICHLSLVIILVFPQHLQVFTHNLKQAEGFLILLVIGKGSLYKESIFPRRVYHRERLDLGHINLVVSQHVQHRGQAPALVIELELKGSLVDPFLAGIRVFSGEHYKAGRILLDGLYALGQNL